MSQSERLVGIQVLRGAAASLVTLGHFCLTTEEYGGRTVAAPLHYLVQFGQTGVDIFFCISGFVMLVAVRRDAVGRFEPMNFLTRRLVRIVPLYWLITAAFVVLVLAANIPKFGIAGALSLPVLDPVFVVKSVLLWPARNPANQTVMPLLAQGWTLSYEMYFYVCIALVGSRVHNPTAIVFALLFVMLAVASLLAALPPDETGVAGSFFASPIFLEFILGATVFVVSQRSRRAGGVFLILGSIGLAVFAMDGASRVLSWGVPAAMILYGVVALERRMRYPRALKLIGDASYSLYLTHGLFTYLYGGLLKRGWFASALEQDIAIAVGSVVAVGTSIIAYRIIEKPMTAWLYRLHAAARLAPEVSN